MSLDPTNAKSRARAKRRWFRFSLRSLLILVTLCGLGMFAKLQWDWQKKKELAADWVNALLKIPSIKGPNVPQSMLPACPAKLTEGEQLELLDFAATRLDQPQQGVAALKLLIELHPDSARTMLPGIARRSRHSDVRALALRLLALYRDRASAEAVMSFLDDKDSDTRAAAADCLGIIHRPSYDVSSHTWFVARPKAHTLSNPPIDINEVIARSHVEKPQPRVLPQQLREDTIELPDSMRQRLEQMMLSGETSEERMAAARALVAWPPPQYQLRVAEWGVWINDRGELKLAQSAIDEIPPFVHRTGNTLASLKDRLNPIVIITKPVMHLTASRPLAADIEVQIAYGRPWFAYPRPDDFSLCTAVMSSALDNSGKVVAPKPLLHKFDDSGPTPLQETAEGFPWLEPQHRTYGSFSGGMFSSGNEIVSLGLRWQSVIVAPQKQSWMTLPNADHDRKHEWWNCLRKVPCSWVSNRGETERFLYYDGPTLARAPVLAALNGKSLSLTSQPLHPEGRIPIRPDGQLHDPAMRNLNGSPSANVRRGMFVQVRDKQVMAREVPPNAIGREVLLDHLTLIAGDDARQSLLKLFTDFGLTDGEARGLLEAWEKQFFETPGERLILLLSQDDYDAMCPLRIRPQPTQLVRLGILLTEF